MRSSLHKAKKEGKQEISIGNLLHLLLQGGGGGGRRFLFSPPCWLENSHKSGGRGDTDREERKKVVNCATLIEGFPFPYLLYLYPFDFASIIQALCKPLLVNTFPSHFLAPLCVSTRNLQCTAHTEPPCATSSPRGRLYTTEGRREKKQPATYTSQEEGEEGLVCGKEKEEGRGRKEKENIRRRHVGKSQSLQRCFLTIKTSNKVGSNCVIVSVT